MDRKCNSTLEHLRILPATEKVLVGQLTFHDLAIIIAAGSTLIAILLSFFLIMMHATHYTVPRQQKHIIRILFMVPVYASSSFLQIKFHWHAIYFQVISDCYEAFAISSFFSLMCHYIAPDLHEQKEYFRDMHPIKPWVWPINWFRACCCADRGPWRTPRSGLTWFNIIWIGVYHYCFIRVAMTITAVVTQYFDRYCESSNSPFFAHIWVVAIEAIAVTIAMYCLIQFYVQLRNTEQLAPHQPFLKILAIKLVIFLSFWQSMAISVGTSTLSIIQPNEVLAYPDIKIGIPSLLLCFEMACFAVLHLWAFPWRGYNHQANGPRRGGFLGMRALWDAINVWDVVKGFGRGMRWLFVGARHRREDASYSLSGRGKRRGFDDVVDTPYNSHTLAMSETTNSPNPNAQNLPIASQFRSSVWYDRRQQFRQQLGLAPHQAAARENGAGEDGLLRSPSRDESAGLIQNAQTPGSHSPSPYTPRSSRSPAPASPSPLSRQNYNAHTHTHTQQHPSVSSLGASEKHDERRPSYVSMDEEMYNAVPMTMHKGIPGPVGQAGLYPGASPHVKGGRNLT